MKYNPQTITFDELGIFEYPRSEQTLIDSIQRFLELYYVPQKFSFKYELNPDKKSFKVYDIESANQYKEYDVKDITNKLFEYTDALRDDELIDRETCNDFDDLRARFYEICSMNS